MTRTGVGCHFSATHNNPEGGDPHGHSYEVKAWFPGGDARLLQSALVRVVEPLDHSFLPDALASGEAMAAHIGIRLEGCIEVEVSRPLERIYARWTAD